ncbi:hypothetical protein PDESU_00276 [Pontiella desulfatans]|uniref:HTH araC/xylS-type domain-containing protein n=1 Tax=Pontiella desulfatans TaxID=2750659 RepID=A0A6C2TVP8_PONDE|nr:helix-turn-helix domain-containing protein [Pontiella desulfatans]VGO11730.1 hypothetical protein PDESU_00276 [Pontiella desulfatans]
MYIVMYNPEQIALPENELRRMPGYCAMFMLEPAYRKQHRFASRLHLKRMQLAHVEAICDEMERESTEKTPGHEIVLRAKLLDLMAYLSRTYMQGESTETQALQRVGEVIGAMEMLLKTDRTITKIAFAVGFNDSNYFTRQFKKVAGLPPRQFRMQNNM